MSSTAGVERPLLEMETIRKRFGGTQALADASLRLEAGKVHALLGENGSGKSTLSRIIAGIHTADSGTMVLAGRTVQFRSPHEALEAGIGIVHQELMLVPALSAAENLFLGQERRSVLGTVSHAATRIAAREIFARVQLDLDPDVRVDQLPIAVRQMLEIARALTRQVRVLILDEPTSALGGAEIDVLFRVVRQLQEQSVAILYISHKMPEIFALAQDYTVLRDGITVASGSVAEATEQELVQSMVGRRLGDYYPDRSGTPGAEILRVENLSRWRGPGREAVLRNISFSVRSGEIVGISGLVGAGRTELLETLAGIAGSSWSGNIILDGQLIRPRSARNAIRQGIALVTEDRAGLGLFRQLAVLSNATVAKLPRLQRFGFLRTRTERRELHEQDRVLQIRRSSDWIPIESLSGGNQQKVILARWLMMRPRVLLLDEPTRGIDVGAKAEIYRVLRQLCDAGVAILFVSSELPEVLGLADQILVMAGGQISGSFRAEEATEEMLLTAALASEERIGSRREPGSDPRMS